MAEAGAQRGVSINLAWVMGVALLFIGVVPGLPFAPGFSGFAMVTGVALALGLLAWFSAHDALQWRLETDRSTTTDVVLIGVFVALMVVAAQSRLNQDLWSDAVYNASMASRQGQLTLFFVHEKLPGLWPAISSLDSRLVIQLVDLVILIGLFGTIIGGGIAFRRRPGTLATIWIGAFLLARFVLSIDHGIFAGGENPPMLMSATPEGDPHPPLRALPIMVSSAILGPGPFGFRMGGYVVFLLVCAGIYIALRQRLERIPAALAVFAIATLPGLWQTAIAVEPSIWLSLAGAILAAALALSSEDKRTSLIAAGVVAALAALMREPGFLALAPFGALAGLAFARSKLTRLEIVGAAALAGIAITAAAVFMLFGTPAVANTPPLKQLLAALAESTPFVAVVTVMGFAPFLLVGAALRAGSTQQVALAAGVLVYFLLALAVFYGPTNSIVWGTPRYQPEIATPLITAGLVAFVLQAYEQGPRYRLAGRDLDGSRGWASLVPIAPLLVVVLFNLFSLATLDAVRMSWFKHPIPPQRTKADAEYEIGKAMTLAEKAGGRAGIYYVGIWYGGFQAVLQGYSAAEFVEFSSLNERHRAGWNVDISGVIGDPSVKAVIVEPEADFGTLAPLTAAGWRQETVTDPHSGLNLLVFTRPGAGAT